MSYANKDIQVFQVKENKYSAWREPAAAGQMSKPLTAKQKGPCSWGLAAEVKSWSQKRMKKKRGQN